MLLWSKIIIVTIIIATIVASTCMYIFGVNNDNWTEADKDSVSWQQWCEEWKKIKGDWTQLSLTPGKKASELNFAWYSLEGETIPKVKIGTNLDMSDSKEFYGIQSKAVKGYISNKAIVTGLQENTTYYYSYGTDGKWSESKVYKTQSTDKFEFILVGDPQIGSSEKNVAIGEQNAQGQDNAVRNDTFNWNDTLNKALRKLPNASFVLSVGDQIQTRDNKNEIEYAGFLSADVLKSIPIATALGNHDAVSENYSYHFNNPNASKLGSTVAGGDYSFRYGNALFIVLNTNNTNIAEHKAFLENTVNNNQDATWRIVTLHQDIYGSGIHSNEPNIIQLRYNLVPIFEKNNIDIVFTGHDHAYARSEILKSGISSTNTFNKKDIFVEEVVNPDGILYLTLNSASGSKYYPNAIKKQDYIASRWQENTPTFSTVSIDDASLTINTYRTDNMSKIDKTYIIVKSIKKKNIVEKEYIKAS